MIQDRQEAFGKSWEQRERYHLFQFVAIHLGAVAAVLFSLGWFNRPVCPGTEVANYKNQQETGHQVCDQAKILERCSESEEKSRKGRKK